MEILLGQLALLSTSIQLAVMQFWRSALLWATEAMHDFFLIMNSERRRQEVIDRVKRIVLKEGLPLFEISIRKYRKIRSMRQNRLYWMWLNIISDETGQDTDDLHQYFKGEFLGYDTRDIFGRPTAIPISTTGLSTQKFTDYLESIKAFAAQWKIILPEPQDYRWIMGHDQPKQEETK